MPQNWRHTPTGLKPGEKFRLLFVTDAPILPSSSDIAHYNGIAQDDAKRITGLVNRDGNDFSAHFRALLSTPYVHAIDNTWTTAPSVPIYWLGGDRVADGYGDFYDGGWASLKAKNVSGGVYRGKVWTGSENDGYKDTKPESTDGIRRRRSDEG